MEVLTMLNTSRCGLENRVNRARWRRSGQSLAPQRSSASNRWTLGGAMGESLVTANWTKPLPTRFSNSQHLATSLNNSTATGKFHSNLVKEFAEPSEANVPPPAWRETHPRESMKLCSISHCCSAISQQEIRLQREKYGGLDHLSIVRFMARKGASACTPCSITTVTSSR